MFVGESIKVIFEEALEQRAGHLKVLLVDDDDFIHEMLSLLLSDGEYELISATGVEDAIRMISTDWPDIVITDAMMPGKSGFSLIEWIKSSPETASIPVILWTILEETNGSVMDASLRADITISKPFYTSNILDALGHAKHMAEGRKYVAKHMAEGRKYVRS
jgi:DNA-binding response OmpR family regulator